MDKWERLEEAMYKALLLVVETQSEVDDVDGMITCAKHAVDSFSKGIVMMQPPVLNIKRGSNRA